MESIEQLKKAASSGDLVSQYELGCKYRDGDGVEVDKRAAFEWILSSAEQGEIMAQMAVAELYSQGDGVKRDVFRAIAWHRVSSITVSAYRKKLPNSDDKEQEARHTGIDRYLRKQVGQLDQCMFDLTPQCPPDYRTLLNVFDEIWGHVFDAMHPKLKEHCNVWPEYFSSLVLGRNCRECIEGQIRLQIDKFDEELTSDDYGKIKELNLAIIASWRGELDDLSLLEKLVNLESIYLSESGLKNISILPNLKNIKELFLCRNRITDLAPLKGLNKLEELYLDGNRIKTLTPLKGLKNLKRLHLSFNHKLKQSQVDELKKALPQCNIIFTESEVDGSGPPSGEVYVL